MYLRTLWKLWREPSLRTHLKFLLIDFLGQVRSPLAEEIWIVRAAFEDQRYRERVIRSTSLGTDWFAHLKDRELPKAMEDPVSGPRCWAAYQCPEGRLSDCKQADARTLEAEPGRCSSNSRSPSPGEPTGMKRR